jgi:3-hydroxyisobutyrate dehydrogenase-like beta-hydroxyacid dehydrogenase
MKVGFIGLGKMGRPMANRLLAHDCELLVRDSEDAALAPFRNRPNVTICASAREVARQAPVVLLSLPSPKELEDVALGADGVSAAGSGRCVIDLSTVGAKASRAVAAALKAKDMGFLDAPVSGGAPAAEKGTLSVMVAGDADLYATYKHLFSMIGQNLFYVGDQPGQAQVMKLVNNVLSAAALVATSEAMAVATKAGISPALALDILNVSSGRNSATEDKFPRYVITGRFDYGFATQLMLKDVGLFEEMARDLAVPAFVATAVANIWRFAVIQGFGPDDCTTIARMLEQWAGVEIRAHTGER